VPYKLGGFGPIFAKVPLDKLLLKAPSATSLNQFSSYTTLALGSAMALFLYPHSTTAFLSSSGPQTLRRNMVLLPAYSLLLGLLALLGYMALAMGLDKLPEYQAYFAQYKGQFAVPALFLANFPEWFVGIAFAAVAIGALVPAAIMSIAAANLFTRNVYKEFIKPDASPAEETKMAKLLSLVVKVGALFFVLFFDKTLAINLQLLGGIWIIQTLPSVFIGLFTRWFDYRALIAGWVTGIAWGTWAAYSLQFKGAVYQLHIGDYIVPGYAALYALILNLIVTTIVTAVVRALKMAPGKDITAATDYMG
jgi:SSS family solute:Na+ symporter